MTNGRMTSRPQGWNAPRPPSITPCARAERLQAVGSKGARCSPSAWQRDPAPTRPGMARRRPLLVMEPLTARRMELPSRAASTACARRVDAGETGTPWPHPLFGGVASPDCGSLSGPSDQTVMDKVTVVPSPGIWPGWSRTLREAAADLSEGQRHETCISVRMALLVACALCTVAAFAPAAAPRRRQVNLRHLCVRTTTSTSGAR
jgi:hypothetical protein